MSAGSLPMAGIGTGSRFPDVMVHGLSISSAMVRCASSVLARDMDPASLIEPNSGRQVPLQGAWFQKFDSTGCDS